MHCPHCGFEVAADFQFCPKCGNKLSRDCPQCGYVCPLEFRYCPKCGMGISQEAAAIPQPPPYADRSTAQQVDLPSAARSTPIVAEAERRPVTVLFADVVGFTSLAEQLDPEELRSLMMGCFQALAEEIRRYDGFIEKFIGDAILAVFGAPVAHEDDPERAIRAALGMQARLQRLRSNVDGSTGGALTMRIGVNTGLVVAGTVGEGKDYGVVGDTVNVAARLQQIGAPGQVTISEETHRLVRKSFECRSLGAVSLKGKTEPIQTFEVVGPRKERASFIDAESLKTPLIGREEELQQLMELFARARKGKTQVVSLIGEAGIGKSRLLTEFLHRLDAEGLLGQITLYQTTCSSLGSEAYHVLIDFFRACFALTPEDSATQARSKIATILQAIGAPPEPIIPVVEGLLGFAEKGLRFEHLDPEQLRRQLFLAVKEICQCQCQQRPVFLVVEDFQWADAASVELLRSLVDRVSDQPLLLLLVARPTAQMGMIYSANVDATVIRLQPLTPEDSEALLDALVGPLVSPFQPALRELVTRRAAGNPFFLEEAVRSLIDTGILMKTPEGARFSGDLTNLEVPTTVQGVILSRFDSLDPGAKQLLLEAAVIGPSFDLELLGQTTARLQELQTYLEMLLRSDLLTEVSGTAGQPIEYRFRNTLIQEVAYNSLLRKRRSVLHGQIARALERLHAQHLDEHLSQLAHHYSLSDDQEQALQYLLRFGGKAARMYANQDAIGCYRRALGLLEHQDGQTALKADVLEKLADTHSALGEPETALESWQAALALYETLEKKERLAAVHRKIGLHWWGQGDREQAVEHFQNGLDLLTEEPESVEAALLYHELGRLHFRRGDDQQAIIWAQKALELGQRLNAPEVLSQASNTVGVSLARRGELEEGITKVEQSLQIALQHDLLPAACRAYTNLGMLLAAVDRERALSYCHEGLALAKRIGDLSQQSWLYASVASSFCSLVGDCSQGIEAAEASVALDQQLGQRNHLPIPLILLAQIYQCQDQLEESKRYYVEACTIAEEIGEPQLLFPCYDGLATLYLALGDTAKTEEYLAKGREICQKTGYTPDALIMLPFLC
jgi:predicted ATPase/class 3 adenylate cyclase